MNYTIKEIASAVNGDLKVGFSQQDKIENILIDSRQINAPQKSIFVALISTKNDGLRPRPLPWDPEPILANHIQEHQTTPYHDVNTKT